MARQDYLCLGRGNPFGIVTRQFTWKRLRDLEDTSYDLIVTLSPEAQHHAIEMTRTMAAEVEFWPTMDPNYITGNRDRRLGAYRQIRDQLLERIKERFPVIPAADI